LYHFLSSPRSASAAFSENNFTICSLLSSSEGPAFGVFTTAFSPVPFESLPLLPAFSPVPFAVVSLPFPPFSFSDLSSDSSSVVVPSVDVSSSVSFFPSSSEPPLATPLAAPFLAAPAGFLVSAGFFLVSVPAFAVPFFASVGAFLAPPAGFLVSAGFFLPKPLKGWKNVEPLPAGSLSEVFFVAVVAFLVSVGFFSGAFFSVPFFSGVFFLGSGSSSPLVPSSSSSPEVVVSSSDSSTGSFLVAGSFF